MLDNCKTAQERWGGVTTIIDRWLEERQELLVRFYRVSTGAVDEDIRGEKLRRLCEILVDYVSAGHFEIYDQLIKEGREFSDTDGLKEGSRLFAIIDQTTEKVLDFNDKYQETDDLTSLDHDLSQLGVTLETRFEAEDGMIAVLHTAHKDLVSQ
ncbi:sigma D regulator [Marinimicrobium alkaliphilum]|uniref:sigma D regulator n=1 Tax=Marinimicrobium alkaliphilum TaxID=2202654 RepID=UPI000DBA97F8|nr:sigma D regulator [Marinimicrobium alkaliphilum]